MINPGAGALRSPEDYRQITQQMLAGAAPDVSAFPRRFHIDYSQVPDVYHL